MMLNALRADQRHKEWRKTQRQTTEIWQRVQELQRMTNESFISDGARTVLQTPWMEARGRAPVWQTRLVILQRELQQPPDHKGWEQRMRNDGKAKTFRRFQQLVPCLVPKSKAFNDNVLKSTESLATYRFTCVFFNTHLPHPLES